MYNLTSPAMQVLIAVFGAGLMLLFALMTPELLLLSLPLVVVTLAALAVYQFPQALVAVMVLTYGLGLDIQLDVGVLSSGGTSATFGAAVVKVIPFALTAVLVLRYGPSTAINWPFLAFTAIAAISIVVLPIGRIISNAEMLKSYIGSTAPFVLAFAMAPRRIWTNFIQGTAFVPIISTVVGLPIYFAGLNPAFDILGRFQGLHTGPFLAGFCITALFACTLEYLRGFKLIWLIIGGLNMAVLLATQARAPFATVVLFLALVMLLSDRKVFPLKRKVDLIMGGMVPGLLLLGPMLLFAMDRFVGGDGEFNYSGRDVIWPYFLDAIYARPLFGFGLGAGKLIVDPNDPAIKILGSSAAHNEYLRLAVDAGIIGCAAIFISIIVWIWGGSRNAAPADKLVIRCALAAALLHSTFDNTLIATISVMQFSLFAAMLARARSESRLAGKGRTAHGRGAVGHRSASSMAWRQSKVE